MVERPSKAQEAVGVCAWGAHVTFSLSISEFLQGNVNVTRLWVWGLFFSSTRRLSSVVLFGAAGYWLFSVLSTDPVLLKLY